MQNAPEATHDAEKLGFRSRLIRWAIVLLVAVGILLIPVPHEDRQSFRLLAIFAATIAGSIVRPIPGAAVVLLCTLLCACYRSVPGHAEAGLSG